MGEIDIDYLVIGAGAAGMAFADALLTHSDATIAIVDRRHAPGGHWIDAYPFVRLHQPSTFYGIDSVPLGTDAMNTTGTNAGFYDLAGADEIRGYYDRVMQRQFLPTKRVRFFPSCDWKGETQFVSRLTGETHHARVRRKIVDTTYLEGKFPATSTPPFEIAEGVRCMSPSELARNTRAAKRFTIVGGGKTALDTCVWLLEQGVPAWAIRWIRPREAWWLNRKFQQPHTLLPDLYRGAAIQIQAMAEASSIDELFARLEKDGLFLRLDPRLPATMFRGALVGEAELELLRTIEDVVRLGHVKRIERDAIVLEKGRVPTDDDTIHVHCAACGVARMPPRPIFQKDRITPQPFFWGFACYQFAMIGVVEAMVESDEDKNRLCPAMMYWDANADYLSAFLATMAFTSQLAGHPKVAAWNKSTRLNPTSGISAHRDDPRVVEARETIKRFGLPAAMNLQKLLGR